MCPAPGAGVAVSRPYLCVILRHPPAAQHAPVMPSHSPGRHYECALVFSTACFGRHPPSARTCSRQKNMLAVLSNKYIGLLGTLDVRLVRPQPSFAAPDDDDILLPDLSILEHQLVAQFRSQLVVLWAQKQRCASNGHLSRQCTNAPDQAHIAVDSESTFAAPQHKPHSLIIIIPHRHPAAHISPYPCQGGAPRVPCPPYVYVTAPPGYGNQHT